MPYHVLATDYDGTLARDGKVDGATVHAIERLAAIGRQLLLVTGREMPELLALFPHVHLFARVVAENGALIYRPATKEEKILSAPPPAELIRRLCARGVAPLAVGRIIIATGRSQEDTVLATISSLGLKMQIIFNKEALMVLPPGVDKASGLAAALTEMGYMPEQTAGVGDAENDLAFLRMCGCAAAVANALPAVKATVDLVLQNDHGAGVAELIDQIIANDLAGVQRRRQGEHSSR